MDPTTPTSDDPTAQPAEPTQPDPGVGQMPSTDDNPTPPPVTDEVVAPPTPDQATDGATNPVEGAPAADQPPTENTSENL